MLHMSDGKVRPSTDGPVPKAKTSEVPPLGVTPDLSALLDTDVMYQRCL